MQAPTAIAILEGPECVFSFVNPLYEKLFGRTREQLLGQAVRQVFPEIEHQGVYEIFEKVYQSGESFSTDEFYVSFLEDGQVRSGYFDFDIQPIRNDEGLITDVMVQVHEVTDRVIAYQKVAESRKQIQLIADNLPVLISYVDRQLCYRFNNSAYEKWFGHTREGISGKAMKEVLGEDAFNRIKPKVEQALSGVPARFEGLLPYKDGGDRFVTADYIPNIGEDKEVRGFYVVVNDITERKLAEQKLEKSENRFRHLINSNIIGVLFWDINGGILDANDAFLQRFGYTREELRQGLRWINMTPEQWRERDRQGVQEILDTGHHMPYEKQYLHKDGTPVDVIAGSSAFVGTGNREGVTFVVDISERKKTEASLKESEARYQSIYRSGEVGLLFIDYSGKVVEANDGFLSMVGYSPEDVAKGLLNIRDITPPADLELSLLRLAEIQETGEAAPFEKQYIHKDGHLVDVWLGGISRVQGKDDLIVGCVLDISERKVIARELEKSEERFAAAVKALQGILWTTNAAGKMEGEQPGWAALTGQSYEEYQGYGWASVVHPDDAAATITEWERAVATASVFEFEHRLRVKDGSWSIFSIKAIPVVNSDGSIREWVGVHTNVTPEREAQRALIYRTALLEAHHEASTDGILLTDAKGRILSVNNRFREIWSVPHSVLDSRDDEKALAVAMDLLADPPAFMERVRYLYAHPDENVVDQLLFRDGRVIERHGYPVNGPDGTFYAWSWTFRDITRQKQLAEQLEKLVDERTRELQQSNNDLQQFAHVASHDLKEPVRKIKTFTNRLEEEFKESLSEKGKLYISKVQSAANRMSIMIDGVLNYSTLSATKVSPERVDLNEVLQHIRTDLEVVIQESGSRLEVSPLPTVEGAFVLLYQLFYNLINNSIKFSREGIAPCISVKAESFTKEGAEFVRIALSDNGIGFRQEYASFIFDTFTRLNPKDRFEGTGLGLSLVKKIVDRHGGTISAEGDVNTGAVFTVELPVIQRREHL